MATSDQNRGMHAALKYACVVALAGQFCVTAGATPRTDWRVQQPAVIASAEESADGAMLESLRDDVNRHPDNFVTFTTKIEASHFLEQHAVDARHETLQRLLELGVLGYWQGRTVVVLPLAPGAVRGGAWGRGNLR
jgi:hypothetical protein